MDVHEILSRLQKVRANGADKWIACCPAHDDNSPSLSIKDVGDRVLLHCFSGCGITEICAAIGLEMHDLFTDGRAPRQRAPGVSRRQVADALSLEFLVLSLCFADMAKGKRPDAESLERERLAWQRVDRGLELIARCTP